MLQELNAFASGRLDVELDDEATPAYADAFAARQTTGDTHIHTYVYSHIRIQA